MPSNAINNPRIDRAFVSPGTGTLTEYGYSVLARIIERVGGPVGDILDGAQLTAAIEALQLMPEPVDYSGQIADLWRAIGTIPALAPAVPQQPEEPNRALEAIVATLARKVNDLENAP